MDFLLNTLMGGVMTNKEILELAEKYFDYQGGWIAYSKEDLLEFARELYDEGYSKGEYDTHMKYAGTD